MSGTIRDVAQRAGVSTATVSRILSGASLSRPATVAAVRDAVDALNYRPSGIARSLKLRTTWTLGLIVTDVQNPFFPEVVRAVEDIAWASGFAILLCNAAGDPDRESGYLRLLEERRVDGMIVAASHVTVAHAASLARTNVPVVLVNCESDEVAVPTILSDNASGGRFAAEHLLALGHRRIAVLAGTAAHADAPSRVAGVRGAMAAAGIVEPPAVILAGATVDAGVAATAELLRSAPETTAIICYNDLLAIGAMRAVRAAGGHVPRDISVVGFDDIDAAAWVDPPLTTIRQHKTAMGRWAVERIAGQLRGDLDDSPQRVVLPVELVIRGSTGIAARPSNPGDGAAVERRSRAAVHVQDPAR